MNRKELRDKMVEDVETKIEHVESFLHTLNFANERARCVGNILQSHLHTLKFRADSLKSMHCSDDDQEDEIKQIKAGLRAIEEM